MITEHTLSNAGNAEIIAKLKPLKSSSQFKNTSNSDASGEYYFSPVSDYKKIGLERML